MLIVDAHLDLSYNALNGRDVLAPARQQQPAHQGIPSVGLPDLREGGVGLICATIFCQPLGDKWPGYSTPAEAADMAWAQMRWYQQQFEAGQIKQVRSAADLPAADSAREIHAIILMEGADPILSPADLARWRDAGVRMIGLAWGRTRYAGGTGAPGPLTAEGIELVREMDRIGMIHDASHLAEESFWQLLERSSGPICATHSNCRAFIPTDRQLSDEMIRAIVGRGGVIGINFYDRFLIGTDERSHRRATLADVVRHIRHICDLVGDAGHVGLGTDMDGGLGREQIPQEIETSADLPKVADALRQAGFSDGDIAGILGGNWLRFFRSHLG